MAKKRGKSKIAKPSNKQPSADDTTSIVDVSSSPIHITVTAKVCRLCETKEGPFLNIFGGEKNTAKKIEELMPFGIAENDDLPHKICFRCSAKVEEFYEFVQKCIQTQENLNSSMGKKYSPAKLKTHRKIWEEKLHQSNITNDDICDAVIKRAMEAIKDVPKCFEETKSAESKEKPLSKVSAAEKLPKKLNDVQTFRHKKHVNLSPEKDNDPIDSKALPDSGKLCLEKCDEKPATRSSSRSSKELPLLEVIPANNPKKVKGNTNKQEDTVPSPKCEYNRSDKAILPVNAANVALNDSPKPSIPSEVNEEVTKPFNIMDHVSKIKVNGVGVLFQCQLCNRNFLKKDVVLTHFCAKNGAAKENFIKRVAPPEPPKIPSVKYINTKNDDSKKLRNQEENNTNTIKESMRQNHNTVVKPESEPKKKPKIGPASKVKRSSNELPSSIAVKTPQPSTSAVVATLDDQNPVVPNLNCRYKLVPGPNNTFTLVEAQLGIAQYLKRPRPTDDEDQEVTEVQRKVLRSEEVTTEKPVSVLTQMSSVKNFGDKPEGKSTCQPYPVGLFQTMNRHSNTNVPPPVVVPFGATEQKKQSYTVVQTGNPSKLLISVKPQAEVQEPVKKKPKKNKPVVQTHAQEQPFSVTLEDQNNHRKEDSFFTFINVDPLLQPSYVLPTDNNVQESQISTSKQKAQSNNSSKPEQYSCNMCNETFSREQKLLVHIHSHYNKMDEEDQTRIDKYTSRKRGKK